MMSESLTRKSSHLSLHKREYVAKVLESCLLDWSIKNIFIATIDNASSNDVVMKFFEKKLMS